MEQLSPDLQKQVEQDIDKLLEIVKGNESDSAKPRGKFGDLKGFVKYIADDFD